MNPESIEILVGRMALRVPVFIDEATTLRVAEQLNARLEECERQSTRIDSLRSALEVAFSLTVERETERMQSNEEGEQAAAAQAAEQREFFQALHRIADAIRQEPSSEE